jgi:hypothetical protein
MKNNTRWWVIFSLVVSFAGVSVHSAHAETPDVDERQSDVTPEGSYNEPSRSDPNEKALVPDPEKLEDLGQAETEFHQQVNQSDPETRAAIQKIEKRIETSGQ